MTADIPLVRLMVERFSNRSTRYLGLTSPDGLKRFGRNVKLFHPAICIREHRFSGFAEYVCAREDLLVLKPASITFEEPGTPMAGLTGFAGSAG